MDLVTASMVTAVGEIADNVTSLIAEILPAALPVMGIVIAVTFGLKFIKKIMK